MASESGSTSRRINISYFEGVNSLASTNLGVHTEFIHAENCRSVTIGTVEKREGQKVLGTSTRGTPFVTTGNYGLFSFQNDFNKGLYRISDDEILNSPSASRSPSSSVSISPSASRSPSSSVSISPSSSASPSSSTSPSVADTSATIYYLNNNSQWFPLSGNGTGLAAGIFDYTHAEDCLFLVNQNAENRYIKSDGTTVVTATDPTGHLY